MARFLGYFFVRPLQQLAPLKLTLRAVKLHRTKSESKGCRGGESDFPLTPFISGSRFEPKLLRRSAVSSWNQQKRWSKRWEWKKKSKAENRRRSKRRETLYESWTCPSPRTNRRYDPRPRPISYRPRSTLSSLVLKYYRVPMEFQCRPEATKSD